MSAEPIGNHCRGKPLPVESIQRLKKWFERTRNICESARAADVSRPTARKYLGLSKLPDLDI